MGRLSGVTLEETRRNLVDATLRVLLARGYEGTRVSEIAREAGVTSGAIYNHFSSKSELLAAAITEHAPDAISNMLAPDSGESVIDGFRRAGAVLPEKSSRVGQLILELVLTSTRDPAVAEVVLDRVVERERTLADIIRVGQDRDEVDRNIDPEALGRVMMAILLGSFVFGALDMKPLEPNAWSSVIDRMLDAARPREESHPS